MKQIIKGKLYDTETAKEIAAWGNNRSTRDFSYCSETLYRKRTGEYFLYGHGGPMSKYAESCGDNSWSGGSKIIPLTYKAAQEWGEEHMDADDYMEEFGPVSESEEMTMLSVSVTEAIAERIRREAQEKGLSVSALIASKFSK